LRETHWAAGLSIAGITLVLVQEAVPTWGGFHDWPYAASLALVGMALLGALRGAESGPAIVTLGSLVIVAAGLGSGLLGPDSETISRAPGTVAPIPELGAAAFFPDAGATQIARGDEAVVLRRRDGAEVTLGPGQRRYWGAVEIALQPHLAAYLEARDAAGRHLTITQPTNAAFLSPIVLFPQKIAIAGKVLPADAFAAPALHREIKVFYFSKEDARTSAHVRSGAPALLFAVDDADSGRLVPGGIGIARSGETAVLGGLHLRGTIGTYPEIVISAVPYEPALLAGLLLIASGTAFAFWKSAPRHIGRKT
jgi:hypothetical protein